MLTMRPPIRARELGHVCWRRSPARHSHLRPPPTCASARHRSRITSRSSRPRRPLEINAALFSAADKGCTALARRLLDDGASLQARDRLGAMPLSRAAKAGHVEIVELFLAARRGRSMRATSTARRRSSSPPRPDNRSAVEALIAHGADVNLPGRSGITPIAAAAYMGNEPLVRLLLDKGADPNVVDGTGKTAICYAAGRGFPAVVRRASRSRRRRQHSATATI